MTSPELRCDVLDLFCDLCSRLDRGVCLVFTTPALRIAPPPLMIHELPADPSVDEVDDFVVHVTEVGREVGAGGVVVGLCQPDGIDLAVASAWRTALQERCAEAGLVDLGLHVVTEDEVFWLDELLAGVG